MKIFVTGAAGWVGSAVVQELLRSGHQAVGLARSEANVASLKNAGAQIHRGSLEDTKSLQEGAAASDGVIHCAFSHDFSKFQENSDVEKRAIEALGQALSHSNRPLIVTSGVALISPGTLATEDMKHSGNAPVPRDPETEAFKWTSKGVRVNTVCLPPSVHGRGDHGFIAILTRLAKEKGVSAYVEDGTNLWPAGHQLDAANLYKLVLDKGISGSCYHAVAEEGVPFKDIATAIGKGLKIPIVSQSPEEATKHFGGFMRFASISCPASSKKHGKF